MATPANHNYDDGWDDHNDSTWFNGPGDFEEEEYELIGEDDFTRPRQLGRRPAYEDGNTIDWLHEEAAERARVHQLRSYRGLRAFSVPFLDASRFWIIVVLTGIGIGVTGAWLDVLVKWLGDLREGRCAYGFFYNQVACCSGLNPGEVCMEWHSWSKEFHIQSILLSSLLQAFIYISLAVAFASTAAFLVQTYAPYAFHTGIPEIKAILSGYVFDEFLGPWTLLIKAVGLALAVASGLSLGKEGPLVHVACCMAYLLSSRVKQFRQNEAQKRRILAAAAAAGVSVAFGSPLGGVLFGLEELDTFSNEVDVMWRGFVTSAIAAMALQYVDPFGTAKLVLFQVTSGSETWRTFELVPWLILGVVGGCLGSLLIKMNVAAAMYRRNSILHDHPIMEVVAMAALTGAVCYLVVFLRVESAELVANLFQECDPSKGDYHGLCNPTATLENIFLLMLTAAVKIALTAWTFGMKIPAGIFMPTIAIGACIGRAAGLIMQAIHRSFPDLWVFNSCPPDPSVRCISPGFYAVIGSAAMLAGVTRMTVSLVVILFELTGALSHVLPIMISVLVSKWVADAVGGKEGIYTVWIALRRYPWLSSEEYRDKGETAAELMMPVERLVLVDNRTCTLASLAALVKRHQYHGFPVVHGEQLMGYVPRDTLRSAIEALLVDRHDGEAVPCTFETGQGHPESVDLSSLLEGSVVQLRKEVPQELVVSTFQKMNLRYALFTQAGKLTGMVTQTDVVSLLQRRFPHTGALAT